MYGLQHGALAHTEQQAIKGPKITSVKPFKRENQRSNLYKIKKLETRNTYKLHKQTTTTVHQITYFHKTQIKYKFDKHHFYHSSVMSLYNFI